MENLSTLLPLLLGGLVIAAAFWLFDVFHESRRGLTPKQARSLWRWGHAGVALCGLVVFDMFALVAGIVLALLVDMARFAWRFRWHGWTGYPANPALGERQG